MGAALERFLILYEDAPRAAQLSEALGGDMLAEFDVARTLSEAAAALKARSYQGVLVHWRAPQNAALFIFELLPQPIPVFAFAEAYTDRELSRALQLGAAGVFIGLPSGPDFSHELDLEIGGVYPSLRRVVMEHGSWLYEPNPTLWQITSDESFVQRLERRAEHHRHNSTFFEEVMRLLQLLTTLDARTPTVKLLSALRRLVDGDAPQAVSEQTSLGVTRLRRLFRAAGQHASSTERLGAQLDEATAVVSQRGYSPNFKRLRLAAAELILEIDARFRATLLEILEVGEAETAYIDEGRIYFIASQIVSERDEAASLHVARFILLNDALERVAAYGLDKQSFQLIGRLLGVEEDSDLKLYGLRAAACLLDDESAYTGFKRFPLEAINKLLAVIAAKGVPSPFNPVALAKRLTQAIEIALTDNAVSRFRLSRIIDVIERGVDAQIYAPTREAISHNLGLSAAQRGNNTNLLWQSLGVLHAEQETRIRAHLDAVEPHHGFSTQTLVSLIKASKDEASFAAWTPPKGSARASRGGEERSAAVRVRLVEGFELDPDLLEVFNFEEAARHPNADASLLEACVTLMSADIRQDQRALILERIIAVKGRDPRFMLKLQTRLEAVDDGLRVHLREHLGLTADLPTMRDLERLLDDGALSAVILGLDEISDEEPRVVPLLNKLAMALGEESAAAAVAYYERALALQPNRLNLQLNLARCRVNLGQDQEARQLLIKIMEKNPGFGDSEALMRRINQRS